MKAHIGADAESGLVHTVRGTSGHVSDIAEANSLLHGDEGYAVNWWRRKDECACKPGKGATQRENIPGMRQKRRNFGRLFVKSHYLKIDQPLPHLAAGCSDHP